MSKLIAFRMPDELVVRFEAWAVLHEMTATAAIVNLIWRGVMEGEPVEVALPRKAPTPKVSKPAAPEVSLEPEPDPLAKFRAVETPRRARGYDAITGEPIY